MGDTVPAPGSPRLPIELCEHVMDAVYDFYYQFVVGSLRTLSRCALVCRAWRPRAQMILFDFVLVRDSDALHRLAAQLDESPRLRGYVHRLALRGYLHVPASTAVLFPTILRLRLPNLTHVYLQELMPEEKAASPLPADVKELPAVPIHPYFPSVLSSFNYIRKLDLVRIRFCSFGDFGRVLHPLTNLRELYCDNVSWGVFGRPPPCMRLKASLGRDRKPFLPKLHTLECYDMGPAGREALVASLGPSVSDMWLKFPNTPPFPGRARAYDPGQSGRLQWDLQSFGLAWTLIADCVLKLSRGSDGETQKIRLRPGRDPKPGQFGLSTRTRTRAERERARSASCCSALVESHERVTRPGLEDAQTAVPPTVAATRGRIRHAGLHRAAGDHRAARGGGAL
ncbi:hypothetical protein C8T65DRAFT_71124 [Cerioporus squamosus]|nr:hypothetical protein C8T65DRAFT_71124 [Cerioporus squamosus]